MTTALIPGCFLCILGRGVAWALAWHLVCVPIIPVVVVHGVLWMMCGLRGGLGKNNLCVWGVSDWAPWSRGPVAESPPCQLPRSAGGDSTVQYAPHLHVMPMSVLVLLVWRTSVGLILHTTGICCAHTWWVDHVRQVFDRDSSWASCFCCVYDLDSRVVMTWGVATDQTRPK